MKYVTRIYCTESQETVIGALIFVVAITCGLPRVALGKWVSRCKLLGNQQQLPIEETIGGLPGQFDRNMAAPRTT